MTSTRQGAAPPPHQCTHESFRVDAKIARVLDVGKFVAEIQIRCQDCGEPFRFVGVPAGLSYAQPSCSIGKNSRVGSMIPRNSISIRGKRSTAGCRK